MIYVKILKYLEMTNNYYLSGVNIRMNDIFECEAFRSVISQNQVKFRT